MDRKYVGQKRCPLGDPTNTIEGASYALEEFGIA
jgi:hypothetical protein